jgi:hypothetical protein
MNSQESGHNDKTVLFVEKVEKRERIPNARLICTDEAIQERFKGLTIQLRDTAQTVGRATDNSVCINYERISRHHARIFPESRAWIIEDIKSTNGISVNGEQVSRSALKHGDSVNIGPIPFRFLVDQPGPNVDGVRSDLNRLGAEGTMYAGHSDVLGSLALVKNDRNKLEQKPALLPDESAVFKASLKPSRSWLRLPIPRLAYPVLLILSVAGGLALYLRYSNAREGEALVKEFSIGFRKFIDNYEGGSQYDAGGLGEAELTEIRDMAAHVDIAAAKFPSNIELKALQAKVLFLALERELYNALADQRLRDASALVDKAMNKISSLESSDGTKGEASDIIAEIRELIELASIVIEFKKFRLRFPDPSELSQKRPSSFELQEMQTLKNNLAKKKRDHHLALSVTYMRFQKIVTEVDENDVRLVNRWQEALQPSTP